MIILQLRCSCNRRFTTSLSFVRGWAIPRARAVPVMPVRPRPERLSGRVDHGPDHDLEGLRAFLVTGQGDGPSRLAVEFVGDFAARHHVTTDGPVDQGLGYEPEALLQGLFAAQLRRRPPGADGCRAQPSPRRDRRKRPFNAHLRRWCRLRPLTRPRDREAVRFGHLRSMPEVLRSAGAQRVMP